MTEDSLQDKYQTLVRILKSHDRLAIAFSGGVDSTFLGAVAKKACDSVLAVTVESEFQSGKDAEHARHMGKTLGLPHVIIEARVLKEPLITENSPNRCYHCKKKLFSLIKTTALDHGFKTLVHGANMDDLQDFRPGFKAAREAGFLAPLLEARLTKSDIRKLSRELGLETWDMPSGSCLAARIPYGDPITREKLTLVEKGEQVLYDLGFTQLRLRCHGDLARIELDPKVMETLLDKQMRQTITQELKTLGFQYVALDLEGYVTGSMNRSITGAGSPDT